MRKGIAIFSMLTMLSGAASAQMFLAGTQEFGGAGVIDFASTDGTKVVANGSYGIYVYDYFQLGGELSLKRSANEQVYALGLTGEYDFDLGAPVFPFAGGHIQVATYDTNGKNGNALVFGLKAGAMAFLVENVAVSAALVGDWATSGIYADDDGTTDLDLQVQFGLRYFY
jgi:hypothetical protein